MSTRHSRPPASTGPGIPQKLSVPARPLPLTVTAVFCTLLWGSAAPFIKWGYDLFSISQTGDILVFAGVRFLLAGLLVILAGSLLQGKLLTAGKAVMPPVLTLAFFQTFGQYFLYYLGVSQASGVDSAVITGTGAFISLLMAVYVFRYEKMTANKALGCLTGFAGILVMNASALTQTGGSLMGEGLILTSQVFSAISAAFIKKFTRTHDAVLLSGWQFACGGLALMLSGLAMDGSMPGASAAGWAVVLYLAFVSAAAYTLWGLLLKEYPLSRVGIFNCIIPVAGVFWSAALLHETGQAFAPSTLAAMALVAIGVWLVNRPETPDKRSENQTCGS